MAVGYTTRLGQAKPDFNTQNWDVLWRQDSDRLEARVGVTHAGNPNGVVRSFYIGQTCLDTSNGYIYRATNVANPGTWVKTKAGDVDSAADADKLGGQLPSYYSNITARLGYTPVNKAGDSSLGALMFTNTAGSASSGLGINGRPGGLLGFHPFGSSLYVNIWNNGGTATRLFANVETGGNWNFTGALSQAGSRVLTDKDTGSGKGLDADTVDGVHASSFVEKTSSARPGVTQLYRADANSAYWVQTRYVGGFWRLEGYTANGLHSECRVGMADLAADANQLGGIGAVWHVQHSLKYQFGSTKSVASTFDAGKSAYVAELFDLTYTQRTDRPQVVMVDLSGSGFNGAHTLWCYHSGYGWRSRSINSVLHPSCFFYFPSTGNAGSKRIIIETRTYGAAPTIILNYKFGVPDWNSQCNIVVLEI